MSVVPVQYNAYGQAVPINQLVQVLSDNVVYHASCCVRSTVSSPRWMRFLLSQHNFSRFILDFTRSPPKIESTVFRFFIMALYYIVIPYGTACVAFLVVYYFFTIYPQRQLDCYNASTTTTTTTTTSYSLTSNAHVYTNDNSDLWTICNRYVCSLIDTNDLLCSQPSARDVSQYVVVLVSALLLKPGLFFIQFSFRVSNLVTEARKDELDRIKELEDSDRGCCLDMLCGCFNCCGRLARSLVAVVVFAIGAGWFIGWSVYVYSYYVPNSYQFVHDIVLQFTISWAISEGIDVVLILLTYIISSIVCCSCCCPCRNRCVNKTLAQCQLEDEDQRLLQNGGKFIMSPVQPA